jgi:cytidylate kinase
MRRIAVVGCGGSGKSHLARGLAAALGLRYVLTYRRRMRPRVLAAVAEHAPDAVLVRLRGRGHARRWLAGVAAARTVR